jgi:hypothetical protein
MTTVARFSACELRERVALTEHPEHVNDPVGPVLSARIPSLRPLRSCVVPYRCLTPFLHDTATGRTMLFMSPRTDAALFRVDPVSLLADPALSRLRSLLMIALGSILAAGGILVVAIAVFALRAGDGWALATLTLAGLVVLPFWLLVFRSYAAAGIALGLSDVPPFM